MFDLALAAEFEPHGRAVDLRVLLTQRREAERLVVPRILLVADANERLLEQLHDGGKDLFARQAGAAHVGGRARANARQGLSERDQAAVFHFVAHLSPSRVITILLASARIAAGRLQVAVRIRADPNVRPRRGDDE